MTVGMIARSATRGRWRQDAATHRGAPDPAAAAQRQQLIESARATNLVQLAGQYTQLRRKAAGEYAGPCPKCGGDDRFVVDTGGWFCRTCKPYDEAHGWYGAIDFVMWMTGLDFKGAVGWLTGAQMTQAAAQGTRAGGMAGTRTAPAAQIAPPAPAAQEQTEEWRREAERIVTAAQAALWAVDGAGISAGSSGGISAGDNAGAEYLESRGLEPGTWQAFGWGFAVHHDRLAIVMPWYRSGRLVAIRYRYLKPTEDGQRLISRAGSRFAGALYGGQALGGGAEDRATLVLCEGEINAASIWQVAHDSRLDVLSLGSESTTLTDAMIAHAARYRHVIVWMDKREVALALREKLPPRTVAVASPPRKTFGGEVLLGPDGKPQKLDANDLLRMGKLGAFLTGVRVKCCGDDAGAKEGLLWDIWDMASLPGGVDPGTGAVAIKLAAELGKDVKLYECPDGAWRVM